MGISLPSLIFSILQSPIGVSENLTAYDLHPGDLVTIISPASPRVSFRALVNRAGFIRTPGGNLVKAIGPEAEVANALGEVLEKELGRTVKPIQWKVSRQGSFRVDGAVRWAGSVRIANPLTAAEVLSAVIPDGVADLSAATLLREGVAFPLDSVRGQVQVGDRVIIPTRDEGANVAVVGAVVRPSTLPLETGLTVKACLEKVGGIALHGSIDQVEILYRGMIEEVVKAPAFATRVLKRGESLRVPRSENVFSVTLTSFSGASQVVEVRDGTKLSEVLKFTGVKPTLTDGWVTVRGLRRDKPPVKGRFSEILSNPLSDVFLSKGDSILVE